MKRPLPNVSLADDGTLDTVFECSDCGEEIRYSNEGMERSEDENVTELERQAAEEHADDCLGYTEETADKLSNLTDGGGHEVQEQ